MLAHGGIHGRILGLPCRQSIDVTVVHAEGGGDQHGVVDLDVGCTLFAGMSHIIRGYVLPALLYLACDDEKSLQLSRDVCG